MLEYNNIHDCTWNLWRTGEDGGIFPAGFLQLLFLLVLNTETFLFLKCSVLVWNNKSLFLLCRSFSRFLQMYTQLTCERWSYRELFPVSSFDFQALESTSSSLMSDETF